MRKVKILSAFSILAIAVGLFGVAPDSAQPATAATSIVYNLYATDAFVPLADGSAVYNYGFVGGRQGVTLTYQKSVSPSSDRALDTGLAMSYAYNGNGVIPTGAPAPTGGPVTAAEAELQGNAQFPAPLIYATVGDVVEIRLKNLGTTDPTAPNDPHSIHLHGLDVDAANDGVPETSIGAVPANLCADGTTAPMGSNCATPAPGAGNVVVYMFSPKVAATYMWHCHQEADIHVQMGMYGALVIYNKGDAAAATGPGANKGGTLYGWKYDKDYVLMESEIGPAQHNAEEASTDYNPVDYHPTYWFLNGLSFPNTIHAGFEAGPSWEQWIAAHPGYDPLIVGSVSTKHPGPLTNGDKVLIRMINMGYETQPMHMHGYHGKVIGSDQRAWFWANPPQITPFGLGLEKQTLTIGSGETYEWLVDFSQQKVNSTYPAGTQSKYDAAGPQSNTTGNPAIPVPGEDPGFTYVGGPQVGGLFGNPPSGGSQIFPFHNHDDYKATNNGQYPGGMFTALVPVP
jgi:FtsP/CotA-like multicopper oxidase with cupredoxin domain